MINFIDATIGAFLGYELGYFKSVGLTALAQPKYSTELDFDTAFIDDEQIFRDNFDTIYTEGLEGRKKLKNWFALAWNRSAILPNTTRANQRLMKAEYRGEDGGLKQSTMRIVDCDIFFVVFANTFDILAAVEQRNIVDRGHDVPVELEINNKYLAKVVINASYPWQNEVGKLPKDKWGGLTSVKYAAKLTFPVISIAEESVKLWKIVVKLGVGNEIVKVWGEEKEGG